MNKLLIIALSIILFAKCVDKIDLLNPENARTMLVIDARMVKHKDVGRVYVDLIQSSFNTDRSFGFIADEVSVINTAGNKLILNRDAIGRYSISETSAFKFTYGQKYKIRVFINNGPVYESAFAELNPSPTINSGKFRYTGISANKEDNLFVSVNTTVNSTITNKVLKWDIIKAYQLTDQQFGGPLGKTCYITEKLDKGKVALIDSRSIENNKPVDLVVTQKLVDHQFAEGTYFTIVQEAIDLNTEKYFIAFNNLVQREGNIFETPPGMLPTNFKCVNDSTKLVTGYFYASQQDTVRIQVKPSDVGSPARQCPVPPNEASDCPVLNCCNCLLAKGSSRTRPSYWR